MTQESPLVICFDCRRPVKRPFARIRGEIYCSTCGPDAVRLHSRANRQGDNPVGK